MSESYIFVADQWREIEAALTVIENERRNARLSERPERPPEPPAPTPPRAAPVGTFPEFDF